MRLLLALLLTEEILSVSGSAVYQVGTCHGAKPLYFLDTPLLLSIQAVSGCSDFYFMPMQHLTYKIIEWFGLQETF